MTRFRLLFLINDLQFFCSHRLALALAARDRGYSVHVAALDTGEGRDISEQGIEVHPLSVDRTGMNPWRDLRLLCQILRVIATVRPHAVHTVTIKPIVYGGLAARFLRVPALVSAIGGGQSSGVGKDVLDRRHRLLRRILEGLYAAALRHPNARTVVQNPEDGEELCARGLAQREHILLIKGSGVDLAVFAPVPEPSAAPTVILPARMLWAKGVEEFVRAAQLIRASRSDVRFALVGDVPSHNRDHVPRSVIENWVKRGWVEWWGFERDMPPVFGRCHIVCLPTNYREGVPRVLLEAAACARAIVATDVAGCREIVRHGENGLLVQPRSPDALAHALLTLIEGSRVPPRHGPAWA